MDGLIRIWDAAAGTLVIELDCGDDLRWLEWHPVANFIIAATESGSVHMWDVPGGNMSFYTGHGGAVTCGGWSPDGRNFITGSVDGTIIQSTPKTGQAINKMNGIIVSAFFSYLPFRWLLCFLHAPLCTAMLSWRSRLYACSMHASHLLLACTQCTHAHTANLPTGRCPSHFLCIGQTVPPSAVDVLGMAP